MIKNSTNASAKDKIDFYSRKDNLAEYLGNSGSEKQELLTSAHYDSEVSHHQK